MPDHSATRLSPLNLERIASTSEGGDRRDWPTHLILPCHVSNHEVVIFDFSDTAHVDESAAMVIEQLMPVATGAQTELIVMGLSGSVLETFIAPNVLEHLPQGRSVQTLDEARDIARRLLEVG